MIKQFQVLFAACVLLCSSSMSMASDEHPAQELVVKAITSMLSVLKNDADKIQADPAYLQAKLDEWVVPHLDFDTMTKLAVGKFWRKADAAQQSELISEFKTMLLNTYSGALTEYSGEKIDFEPFRPEDRDDRAVVRSTFRPVAGNAVPVVYKLRDKAGWGIYDIEVNSISLVTSYRTAFTNEIGKGGIAGLIETLKQRNAKS